MTIIIYIFIIFLFVYLCTLNTTFFVIIVIFSFIFLFLIINSHISFKTIKYDIKDSKIDKNIKIMLLSDMHNRDISNKIVECMRRENPDYVIMSGDMVNGNIDDVDNFFKLLDKIDCNKVYYVFGNNEEEICEIDKIKYLKILGKYNINLLNNKSVSLSKNIILNGISVSYNYYKCSRTNKSDIGMYLLKCDRCKYNILVAHNPLWNDFYSDYDYDLSLSGHVHGGVVRIPFIGGVFSPEYKFFPKYDRGKYKVKNMISIVSSGIGYSRRLKFRMFNPGEVVIINLLKNI